VLQTTRAIPIPNPKRKRVMYTVSTTVEKNRSFFPPNRNVEVSRETRNARRRSTHNARSAITVLYTWISHSKPNPFSMTITM